MICTKTHRRQTRNQARSGGHEPYQDTASDWHNVDPLCRPYRGSSDSCSRGHRLSRRYLVAHALSVCFLSCSQCVFSLLLSVCVFSRALVSHSLILSQLIALWLADCSYLLQLAHCCCWCGCVLECNLFKSLNPNSLFVDSIMPVYRTSKTPSSESARSSPQSVFQLASDSP